MRIKAFCIRNIKELLRDPLSYIFCLGFPIIMVTIMTIVNNSIPKEAGIEILPDNLYDAIKYLNEDKFICGVLGEHITTKYTEAKLKEWDDYKTQVTQWELDEYLYKF